MLSINTNLSSLIAQTSMKQSTNLLNQAVERLTTGSKLNHAKDNAANYAITTNMTTRLNSFMVAEDNALMGLDLISTAEGSLSQIRDKLTRLRDLAEQSSNGTYGEQSKNAINSEANALVDEINRIYSTAEYNGQKLFNTQTENATPAMASEPIAETPVTFATPRAVTVDETKRVSNVTSFTSGETYYICDSTDLVALQDLVNVGTDTTGVTFELTASIDMNGIEFRGIGACTGGFKGIFNGNNYSIKNLTINKTDTNNVGLFSSIGSNATIDSVVITDCNITGGNNTGALAGSTNGCTIQNCYVSGTVNSSGTENIGGLVGYTYRIKILENCYSTVNVTAINATGVGGLFGSSDNYSSNNVKNCHASGNISGKKYVGGLIGAFKGDPTNITNCSATGNVEGSQYVGGLIGYAYRMRDDGAISNCYATGNVEGTGQYVGGLVGSCHFELKNCYAMGNVTGNNYVGGLAGRLYGSDSSSSYHVNNCYSTGEVIGTDNVGGFAGEMYGFHIYNSYSSGNATGNEYVGGFIGKYYSRYGTRRCYSTGEVVGTSYTGGFIGDSNATFSTCRYNKDATSSTDTTNFEAVAKSIDEIQTEYSSEILGYTEANGWKIVDGNPLLSWHDESSLLPPESPPDYIIGSGGSTTEPSSPETPPASNTKPSGSVSLQIGSSSGAGSSASLDLNLTLNVGGVIDLRNLGLDDSIDYITTLDTLLSAISEKEVEFGAATNRLESVLEEISIQTENLVSARSTIRDADIAEVSSAYIRQQILQQASATLLSTANQSPSIALQLI